MSKDSLANWKFVTLTLILAVTFLMIGVFPEVIFDYFPRDLVFVIWFIAFLVFLYKVFD